MITLLPRLPTLPADRILDAFLAKPDAWPEFNSHDLGTGTRFAATGGSRATAEQLRRFRSDLVVVARHCGFGEKHSRDATATFDAVTGAWLAESPLLSSGEALRDDVWTFIGVVVAPDIVFWRFGKARERYLGGIRNTLQRLYLRARVLDRGPGATDRWKLLEELSEDALVAITERPSIGGSPVLARELAEGWVRTARRVGKASMQPLMRRATLQIRIWNEIRDLASIPRKDLSSLIDSAFAGGPPAPSADRRISR